MSEKILVVPGDVRGLGNIVSPKTLSDFDVNDSVLTSSSDTVDGKTLTVYNLGYRGGSYFTVTSGHFVVYSDSLTSISLTAVLKKHSDDSAITSSSVSCIVNNGSTLTGTTNSSGSVTFSIPYNGAVNIFDIKLKYAGTNSIGGCTSYYRVVVGTPTGIGLVGSESIIQTGETAVLIATVTGTIGEETVPLPYQTVSFYEEYTPTGLSVYASPNPVQDGDTTTITAVLKDSDGSAIKGETVDLYADLPYEPVATDVNLTADKTVISSYNGEKSVLSAVVVDQCGLHMGPGLSVTLKKGSTTLDTLTTGINGSVSYEYTGIGDGDVTFTAEYSSLSDTLTIEDCWIYNPTEQTFTSTETKVETAMYSDIFDVAGTNWELTYDIKTAGRSGGVNIGASTEYTPPSTANYRLFIGGDGTNASFNNRTTSSSSSTKSMSHDEWHTLKLSKSSTSITGYVDTTSIATKTVSWLSNYNSFDLYWTNWGDTNYMKNLKVKKVTE